MKYINLTMVLLFVIAAALQYNDPDPLVCIGMYGLAAMFCVMFAIDKFPLIPAAAFAAACLIGGVVLLWSVFTGDPATQAELFNESCGLLLVFLWISTLGWTKYRVESTLT